MSNAGPSGTSSKAPFKDGLLRSSSPARVAKQKSSSSSLSSQLSAHLSKPIAPKTIAQVSTSGGSPSLPTDRRALVGVQQSGKALASAADAQDLAESELWKSNAAKRAEKAWALQSEKSLQSDPKFKKYTLAVEKSLATFESVSEWADFISFLGRLLKTFQLSTTFNVIPRKLIVAKRLSQCLNPALPSGVHQRALDVYEHILTIIGREGLRRDLFVWTPGLMPFFQYASTSVKPIVLSIFERHYLALGQDLRPITRAFLLAGLPGLEEETNEFFDRVFRLLDRTKESIGQPFLLQNLCLILISTPASRLPALNYLAKRLPRLNGDEVDEEVVEVSSVIGTDLGLLVRAFAAALEDETTLLVRRAALDILVTHLRLDSPTWKEHVKQEDKVRLMKSALAVVLRRDLSLNRRLYAWILGPSEEIPIQQKYFESNAQQLSRLALLSDFVRCPLVQVEQQDRERQGIERQRPYKIFVSLLDKWSIGQPLTNALVLDTYHSLQHQMAGVDDDDGLTTEASLKAAATDISTTAKMLFEVVDPFATYRQFYYAIAEEMKGIQERSYSAISLLCFVLKSFRVHDEESRQIHLPVLFSTIVESLDQCKDDKVRADAVDLAGNLLNLIPKKIFIRTEGQLAIKVSFESHAKSFYESDSYNADEAAQRYIGFQHPRSQEKLLSLCATIPEGNLQASSLQLLSHLLRILNVTMDVASDEKQLKIPWRASEWVQSILPEIQTVQQFDEMEAFASAIVDGATCRALEKTVRLDTSQIASIILTKLLGFLQVQWAPYHVRTVELIWSVADLARGRYIEKLLCKGLTSQSSSERRQTRDIFGALWQYSSEERLVLASITEPLLQILDGLRSTEWNARQASEKWLKANLRGHTLFLDPLLQVIIESGIRRKPNKVKHDDGIFEFQQYQHAFDHEKVLYALGITLQLARFGGQGFVKALRSVQIKRSRCHSIIVAYDVELESSYLQILLTLLLSFIRTDPMLDNPYSEAYTSIHVFSAEILQALVLRGPLHGNWLSEVEVALLERLYISIHRKDLAIQNNLLQALQGVIRAKTSEGTLKDESPNSLLLVIIRNSISKKENRPILPHWADFIINIVPHYRRALTSLLLPLNEIVCQLLLESVAEHQMAFQSNTQNGKSELGEAEFISLMNMNERLLLQCLDSADSLIENTPTTTSITEKADSTGLIGTISNVFQADGTSNTSTSATTNVTPSPNAILRTLHHSIRSLHAVWAAFSENSSDKTTGEAKQRSLEVINPKIKSRCRRSLEKIYRNNSGEVVESLIDCWNVAGGSRLVHLQGVGKTVGPLAAGIDNRSMETTMDILSTLAPSAQIVVTFLCDVISNRTSSATSSSDKMTNRKASTPIVAESVLMTFWEAYLNQLDSSASMQIWPVVSMLVRDIIHNSSAHKAQMLPTFRCLTVTGEKIAGSSGGNEDKRIKRELIDNYIKLFDFNILIAGRSFEQTNWIGRRALASSEEDGDEEGRATPTTADEKMMGASLPDLMGSGTSNLIESINEYISNRALAALHIFGIDQDKILAICSNLIYYIVSPVVRQRRKTLEIPLTILKLLTEITKLPGTVRAWKNVVVDVFQDPRFFQMRTDVGLQWLPVILALLNSDKERFVELVAKVTSTPSTNIFTNKEAETLVRGTNLRRITCVIYSAGKDHWLTHLPPLQEKLVDLLRNGTMDPIDSEVYLCLRVLLLRFSSRHLSAFWPVIITELMRLFEGCLEEIPADDSDALQLVFSACKFLDLLLTLQTDDFQIHQWLFITDTVDVVFPPSDWTSESILDRMASALSERKGSNARSHTKATNKVTSSNSAKLNEVKEKASNLGKINGGDVADFIAGLGRKREPMLSQMGATIPTIETLEPFFATVSLNAFEQAYDCGEEIDWRAVEQSLESDIFPVEE